MKQKIEGGEEEQIRILSKCSPELLLIVGKHSTLWNYSKLETVEKIADLLASERKRCVDSLPEEIRQGGNLNFSAGSYNQAIRDAKQSLEKLSKSQPRHLVDTNLDSYTPKEKQMIKDGGVMFLGKETMKNKIIEILSSYDDDYAAQELMNLFESEIEKQKQSLKASLELWFATHDKLHKDFQTDDFIEFVCKRELKDALFGDDLTKLCKLIR